MLDILCFRRPFKEGQLAAEARVEESLVAHLTDRIVENGQMRIAEIMQRALGTGRQGGQDVGVGGERQGLS